MPSFTHCISSFYHTVDSMDLVFFPFITVNYCEKSDGYYEVICSNPSSQTIQCPVGISFWLGILLLGPDGAQNLKPSNDRIV